MNQQRVPTGTIMRRLVVPLCLLLAGIGSFVYGTWIRRLPVTQKLVETVEVKKQREVQRPIPFIDPLAPPQDPGMSPDLSQLPPFAMPPPMMQTVIETYTAAENRTRLVTQDELESTIIQETTVGGVERLESGGLQRTYELVRTKDGKISTKGPPGCPT